MSNIFNTYNQYPIDIVAGHDWHLTDKNGQTYLDFTSGIGVCNFGYSNEQITDNVFEQATKIWHTSNLYQSQLTEDVAGLLAGPDKLAFFCNSGTEANEDAMKFARKTTGRSKMVTFHNSFHGRTYGAMSLTGNEAIKVGYAPLVPDVTFGDYNSNSALSLIDDQTAGVILEVVQGEGGVINGKPDWLTKVQTACHQAGALLIIDEVQTGIGRTGKKFAYQHYNLNPDVVTVAKGIGNGLPLGAMLGKKKFAATFGPGSQGTTFGGNKLSLAAAKGVLQQLTPSFLAMVDEKAASVWNYLNEKIDTLPAVESISGLGLMIGVHLSPVVDVNDVITQLQAKGLLTLSAKHNTLRLLPPLVMTEHDLKKGLDMITDVLESAVTTTA